MKKLFLVLVALFLLSTISAFAQGKGFGSKGVKTTTGLKWVDANGDGICDNFVDANGDGINDIRNGKGGKINPQKPCSTTCKNATTVPGPAKGKK